MCTRGDQTEKFPDRRHIRMVDRTDRRALAEQYYKWLTHILENAF